MWIPDRPPSLPASPCCIGFCFLSVSAPHCDLSPRVVCPGHLVALCSDFSLSLPPSLSLSLMYAFFSSFPGVKFPVHLNDVLEALAWLRTNVAVFGGDADKVILAGHSVGNYPLSLPPLSVSPRVWEGKNLVEGRREGRALRQISLSGMCSRGLHVTHSLSPFPVPFLHWENSLRLQSGAHLASLCVLKQKLQQRAGLKDMSFVSGSLR